MFLAAGDFGMILENWSCTNLRAGGPGCDIPGLPDVFDTLLTDENGFKEMRVDPLVDIIQNDLLVQLSEGLDSLDNALRRMQSDIAVFVTKRLRVASLAKVNYSESAVREYDASHPRWKSLLNTSIEDTNYFVPVSRESTLHYPSSINPDDRVVRLVANASIGLEETFLQILHDNTDAGMTSVRWQRFTSDAGVTRQFPATFDDSGRDERLQQWYCQATQVVA
jgi:hypothetical protein